jgi:hypothetical protein
MRLGPGVGQVLSVGLHEPRVLSETERPAIYRESGLRAVFVVSKPTFT